MLHVFVSKMGDGKGSVGSWWALLDGLSLMGVSEVLAGDCTLALSPVLGIYLLITACSSVAITWTGV